MFRNEPRARGAALALAMGLGLLAGAAPAPAQDATGIRVNTEALPIEATNVEVRDGAVLLTLEEAIEVALRQNLALSIERYARTQTRLGVEQSLGIYDLFANVTATAADQSAATVSELQAGERTRQQVNFSINQLFPNGGLLSVGWENSRGETDDRFARLNPSYSSNLTFRLAQPLLRGFGQFNVERQLLIARRRSELSRETFERQVSVTTQQVIEAYWALVEARQQFIVAQQSLNLAKELHDRNRIQVEVGTMAPLDLVQSEANVAERDEDIIQAQAQVGDREDDLRRLLNIPEGQIWGTEIRPVTDPVIEHRPIDVEEAIRTAIAERPELRERQLQIQEAEINQRFFRSEARPNLNLDISYGLSGVGGTARGQNGQIIDTTSYSDALAQVTGLDFDAWQAQVVFEVPLQNRQARAQRAISNLALTQAQTVLEDTRDAVVTEVRQAARRVETAAKQIEAAKASRVFQERNLEAQRKRYENGMATVFEITQVQEDLTRARSREVTAIIAYRTALSNYHRATGRLLDESSIALEDQEANVDRWQFSLGRR